MNANQFLKSGNTPILKEQKKQVVNMDMVFIFVPMTLLACCVLTVLNALTAPATHPVFRILVRPKQQ